MTYTLQERAKKAIEISKINLSSETSHAYKNRNEHMVPDLGVI